LLFQVNRRGRVAEIILTTFLVAPAEGFQATLYSLAALNLLCGAGILAGPARQEEERPPITVAVSEMPVPLQLTRVAGALSIFHKFKMFRMEKIDAK
jgi:hypothetical protein